MQSSKKENWIPALNVAGTGFGGIKAVSQVWPMAPLVIPAVFGGDPS